jgi:hypothetical protein
MASSLVYLTFSLLNKLADSDTGQYLVISEVRERQEVNDHCKSLMWRDFDLKKLNIVEVEWY